MILNFRAPAALAALAALSLSVSAVACAAPTDETEAYEVEETSQDLVSRSAYFETFQGIDGQHYFHLMAGNGQKVLRSEGYATNAGAVAGVATVTANGRDKRNFELLEAQSGEWYFNLKSPNGEIIGSSQLYSTKSNAERGARTVRALVRIVAQGTQQAPRRERFELFKGEDSQTYFRLRAGNGEIMLSSESYASKTGAKNGLASVQANGHTASQFQVFEAYDGAWGIRLVATNGQIIARGETYASKSNANRAVSRLVEILGRQLDTIEQ
jgi:uncharacterized protein